MATGRDLLRVSVGLEQAPGKRLSAWALNVPGASGIGWTAEEAVADLELELGDWIRFFHSAGEPVPDEDEEIELAVDEWLLADEPEPDHPVPVIFDCDLEPLTRQDVERGLQRLGEMRRRLLARIRHEREDVLERRAGNGKTVRENLEELARMHWWTLSRLGASPMAEVPEKTVARLDTSMALVVQTLTMLPDEKRAQLLVLDNQEWTPRKVMRRLLWLEWILGNAALNGLGVQGPPRATPRGPVLQPNLPPNRLN
ncbi:MAG TPA: hypothetical protein VFQ45_09590 [Longimicrobium sp.]|nr:hypothetical protein [Longimicrobium sp.]